MENTRNYRAEIETVLAGGRSNYIPFTFYDLLFPAGVDVAPLQAKGMAICARRDVYREVRPNITVRSVLEPEEAVRTIYETPRGTITALHRVGGYGALSPAEHPIKSRDDYAIAELIIKDTQYEPLYDDFLAEQALIGDTGITIAHSGYSPLLDIQIGWIGQEQFCYELADNYDAVMSLYEVLVRKHAEMHRVVADSPAEYVLHCGNLVPEMIGLEMVRDYVFPVYNNFADLLRERGKKLGVHLDANNSLIMDLVRDSHIDLIEAFTPPPDCNVSVAEARAQWPGKRLWINFPSSVHIAPDKVIREITQELITEAGDGRGFLMGVTEDVPATHLIRSISIILDTINEYGL